MVIIIIPQLKLVLLTVLKLPTSKSAEVSAVLIEELLFLLK